MKTQHRLGAHGATHGIGLGTIARNQGLHYDATQQTSPADTIGAQSGAHASTQIVEQGSGGAQETASS